MQSDVSESPITRASYICLKCHLLKYFAYLSLSTVSFSLFISALLDMLEWLWSWRFHRLLWLALTYPICFALACVATIIGFVEKERRAPRLRESRMLSAGSVLIGFVMAVLIISVCFETLCTISYFTNDPAVINVAKSFFDSSFEANNIFIGASIIAPVLAVASYVLAMTIYVRFGENMTS